jgi:hypothetical protein
MLVPQVKPKVVRRRSGQYHRECATEGGLRIMIAFRDFAPQRVKPHGVLQALKGHTYETFDAALTAANDWIQAGGVKVVNVETVVLPNFRGEEGTTG